RPRPPARWSSGAAPPRREAPLRRVTPLTPVTASASGAPLRSHPCKLPGGIPPEPGDVVGGVEVGERIRRRGRLPLALRQVGDRRVGRVLETAAPGAKRGMRLVDR